jgi:CheY-like chemotaxis protein
LAWVELSLCFHVVVGALLAVFAAPYIGADSWRSVGVDKQNFGNYEQDPGRRSLKSSVVSPRCADRFDSCCRARMVRRDDGVRSRPVGGVEIETMPELLQSTRRFIAGKSPGPSFMQDRPKMVAIVDNDPSMLNAIKQLLNAHGLATQTFSSAEEFLDGDATDEASCLVLDINLEGMSGIDLRRRLTACGSQVPIIFMTAADDAATRHEAMEAGCIAYLRKPFSADLLVGAVCKATGKAADPDRLGGPPGPA